MNMSEAIRAGSRPRCTDPDAAAYIAAVHSADGQALENAVQIAICKLVTGLKADGLWGSLGTAALLCGARTLSGALVPLAGSAPSNMGFLVGDYDRKTGLKGNGTSKYLGSNCNNNAAGQNDSHNAVWISEQDNSGTSIAYMGAGVANTGTNLLGKSGIPPYNTVVRSRASAAFTATTSGAGLLAVSRGGSASYTLRIAGANQTVTQASQTPFNGNVFVFARNAGGTPDIYFNGRSAFYSIGSALDLAILDARLATYLSALSVAIP